LGLADIARIKERFSCLEYARNVLGLPVRKSGDRCCSLGGGGNPTAMVIYDEWWYDFKLAMGGDVIDLCACARHDGDKGAAIRDLGGGDDPGWVSYTQSLCNQIQAWHEALRECDIHYLKRRRITLETARRLKIGFDGERLVIPYMKNGYIAYYVSRERSNSETSNDATTDGLGATTDGLGATTDGLNPGSDSEKKVPKYKKAKLDGMNENIPWGLHTLDRENPVLIITEGVFDAISFEQEGYRVLSPMGGHFNKDALKQVLDICKTQENVFLCFDSDDAGSRFQTTMGKTLFRHQIPFLCGALPEGIKDVSDYYAAGGSLQGLVDASRPGLEVLCERITDRQEFKDFAFHAARFVGRAEMAELFELVADTFPKAWLSEVKRTALAPPPEDMIIKELVAEKRLKFFDALGFYEYGAGVWKSRGDSEIKAYIADALGHHRTGGRVSSIFLLLKAEVVSTELFDRKPLFNFRNCVLDLETGETHPHAEGDMCSVQAPYDYDSEAFSPGWAKFIEEIAGGDEDKINLLQEIAGYVLFNDNSLQKCFFLIGEGANGKSVFLDVLSAVFGEENVSNVEMSGLVEPFQRIHLLNSVLNISSETQSNVKGAESIFKQIVVGDAINGCFKNKDFLTFRPRTKLISACNEFFKSRDMTSGFLRRICFVNFDSRFVDAPGEGEYLADKEIGKKLKENLSAVFNWAYAGYKILRERRCFTETGGQRETMEGFMRENNPVVAFIEEELDLVGKVSRDDLYKRYVRWCAEAGHAPMSRTKFMRQFAATAKQMRVPFEEYKSHGTRGFAFFSRPA